MTPFSSATAFKGVTNLSPTAGNNSSATAQSQPRATSSTCAPDRTPGQALCHPGAASPRHRQPRLPGSTASSDMT